MRAVEMTTLMSLDLMCSSNMNCEKTKNFLERNWYVKLTVVFMMPVPCVRIELATWRMLIVFRCLLLLERSTKICNVVKPKFHYANFTETSPWHLSRGTRVMGKFWGSRWLITGKSPTWIMLRGSHGDVSGCQSIATSQDSFKNSSDKSETNPFAMEKSAKSATDTGKSATSQTNQQGRHGFVANLSQMPWGSRYSGIWA